MNTRAMILAVVFWLVCAFAALAFFFISRINSVKKYTEQAIERANTRTDERLKKFDNSYIDQFYNLGKRVGKLEDSKICVLEADTDKAVNTSLYAITKIGYSTIVVSLTEDELAVIDSFIDWAELDEDFSAEKLDQDYTPVVWRNKE